MKRRWICAFCCVGMFLLAGGCASSDGDDMADEYIDMDMDTEVAERLKFSSRLVSLGTYKGLTYNDLGDTEPSDEEVEDEMLAILEWFEGGELTDGFLSENLGYDSVEEFREETKKNLRQAYEQERFNDAAAQLYREVVNGSEFEMDSFDIEVLCMSYVEEYRFEAQESDMDYGEYLTEVLETTEEELEAGLREAAEEIIQVSLVMEAIAEAENFDAESAYDEIAEQFAEQDGYDSVEQMEEFAGGREAVKEEILYYMVAQFMMEHATAST